MSRRLAIFALIAGLVGAVVFWVVTTPATVPASALPSYAADPDNGRTMFHAGGCTACHAIPGEQDRTKLGGGMALKSPYGVFYPPNISSDPRDGIGAWTEANFVTAMWKGTSPDGRHYFPAFPYTSYQRMRLKDVRDLFGYLKTLPAVPGRVRDDDLPFPFNIRRTLGGWKLLFLDGEPFKPDAARSAQWNRGAYLVNGPGHCAECHSPRNLLGGIVAPQRFAGGPNPEGEGIIPNITQNKLGDWSEEDFANLLEFGETPAPDMVSGLMKAVVAETAQLSRDDRAAMAVYLKSLPPVEGPKLPEARQAH